MPNIQVRCPECRAVLEVGAEHEGQEIECGGCQSVFVATAHKPRRSSESGRGEPARGSGRRSADDDDEGSDRRRRRREEDFDDDDDDDDYRPRRAAQQNGLAVTSLVLGLVSMMLVLAALPILCVGGCCCPPVAWLPLPLTVPTALGAIITGALGVRKPEGKGMAVAGLVLGSLALCAAVLQLAFGFLPFLAPPPR